LHFTKSLKMKKIFLSIFTLCCLSLFSQQGNVDNLMGLNDIQVEYSAKKVDKDSILFAQITYQAGYENVLNHPKYSLADAKAMIASTIAKQDTLMMNIAKAIEGLEKDQEKIRAEYDLYPKRLGDQMLQVIDRKTQLKQELNFANKIKEQLLKLKL